MALRAVSLSTKFEGADAWHFTGNSLKRLAMPCFMGHFGSSIGRPVLQLRCSLSSKSVPSMESEETPPDLISTSTEEEEEEDEEKEEGHVTRFKMSDFKVLDYVSTGLGGRADEVVFEAAVKNTASPLHNSRVVLRRLTSAQAQRRGRRAMEVLKKLARRRMLYHSYSMQVHGYVSSNASVGCSSFTLVHGYHGSFSLRHWLRQSDWLPTLEATLALDEESVRKVGEDSVGGPAVSRQLRIIRILMRDLLICVNYLHSHGLAHTELRLENVHISPVDRHIKVGILGNAADFYEDSSNGVGLESSMDRREMMIAFDMRCVGFMMAKMVLRELMDPSTFSKFKSFFMKGNDPTCLREFLLQIFNRSSPSGHVGLQMLDRNWGAGWNLLSLLLATKPSKRISCLDALRHPFLCGPRWRVIPSLDFIRWGLGSTAVRIIEEYIYGQPQRDRLAHFIELMEMLNPHSRPRNWLQFLPGKWRLLYSTSRHIGLTLRQPSVRVLIDDAHLTIIKQSNASLSLASEISFRAMTVKDWPLDKSGINGKVQVNSIFRLKAGRRMYLKEEETKGRFFFTQSDSVSSVSAAEKLSSSKWKKAVPFKEPPSSLPVVKLLSGDMDITVSLGEPMQENVEAARKVLRELRVQIPPEMFDLSKLVCGTYVDSRMLVLRSVSGSALLFTRSVN